MRKLGELSLVDLRLIGFSNLALTMLFFLGAIFVVGSSVLEALFFVVAGILWLYNSMRYFDVYNKKKRMLASSSSEMKRA